MSDAWEVVDKPHATRGASGYFKWGNCHGSLRLEARYPNEDSPYAAEGTKAHLVAERLARAAIKDKWKPGPARTIERACFFNAESDLKISIKQSGEMMDACEAYVNYLRGLIGAYPDATYAVLIEHEFNLSWLRPDMWGTCDALVIVQWTDADGEIFCELHVIDFKYGMGVMVSAKENWQLAYYALGAYTDLSIIYNFTSVHLHVVQPRIENFDGWETTVEWLTGEYQDRLAANYDATLNPNAELNPGTWCKKNFCRARGNCPAIIKMGLQVYNAKFSGDAEVLVRQVHSDDALAMRVINVVRVWADAREAEIKQKLLSHRPTTAASMFKVVPGKASRVLINEAKLVKQYPFKEYPELWEAPAFKSPAQIEKACKADIFGVLDFANFAPYIEKTPGAPTIAPIDDKRAPIDKISQAQSEFTGGLIDETNLLDQLLG
jgi:hypothetical protein